MISGKELFHVLSDVVIHDESLRGVREMVVLPCSSRWVVESLSR